MVNSLPFHLIAYGGLIGTTGYQSFFAGITAYRALPVEMFSKLQHRIFPGYFSIQTALSVLLLASAPSFDNRQGLVSLAIAAISSAINLGVVMPLTNTVIVARDKQVEIEGKSYKDPTVSADMKKLNAKFAKIHGISMIFNLAVFLAVLFYGFHLGSRLTFTA